MDIPPFPWLSQNREVNGPERATARVNWLPPPASIVSLRTGSSARPSWKLSLFFHQRGMPLLPPQGWEPIKNGCNLTADWRPKVTNQERVLPYSAKMRTNQRKNPLKMLVRVLWIKFRLKIAEISCGRFMKFIKFQTRKKNWADRWINTWLDEKKASECNIVKDRTKIYISHF